MTYGVLVGQDETNLGGVLPSPLGLGPLHTLRDALIDDVRRKAVGQQGGCYFSARQWNLFGNLDKCCDLIVEEVNETLFCIGRGSQ